MILRCLVGLLVALLGIVARADGGTSVRILHVNDVYQLAAIDAKEGRGGFARLATAVRQARAAQPRTLVTFGGDTLSPSPASGALRGRQMIAGWNAVGIDVAVPGNHEYDFGPAVALARFAESRFPWLAANLSAKRGTRATTGVVPARLFDLGGVRVGVVGLITPTTPTLSQPGAELAFADPLPAARREAARLKRRGAQLLIGLTHMSMDEDKRLAAAGVFDLILGGHEHGPLAALAGRTPILKAGSDLRDLLRITASFDRRGRLTALDWDLEPLDRRYAEDAELLALGQRFEAELGEALGVVIGETGVELDARGEAVRGGENALANFVADAVREHARADIALMNGGGFRSNRILPPGPLTRLDCMQLLPFANPVHVLRVPGAVVRRALEHGIDRLVKERQTGALPHVAGLRLRYDPAAPAGARLVDIAVGEGANWAPLDDAREYTLATSAYIAGGGDGYAALKGLAHARDPEGALSETEVLAQAIERKGRIAPVVDGRFTPVGRSAEGGR